jgi:hypothetical protein
MLYKVLHTEMEKVRATRNSATPQKLNVRQNQLITSLTTASNVEEISDLNPLLEAEIRGKTSWTGALGGLGDSKAVNRALRRFHPSMRKVFGFYSPDSSEVGIKRTLAVNARIKDNRGRLELNDNDSYHDSGNLAWGELLGTFTATHADPPKHTWGF